MDQKIDLSNERKHYSVTAIRLELHSDQCLAFYQDQGSTEPRHRGNDQISLLKISS